MERKGISQVLFLIIAASVLMMVALTLIFMFQSGAGNTADQANSQACISSTQAKCGSLGSQYVRMPSSCTTLDAGQATTISSVPYDPVDSEGGQITTPTDQYGTSDFYVDCGNVN